MEIVHTIKDLQAGLSALRAQGKKVGLVPTMGALHAGHASLVKRCVAENDAAVVSVFVNPTQFNDKNDLVKYPRTPEADCRLLEECGAAFVFAPSVEEMYPEPDTRRFSYAPLDTVMEGAFRPEHFNGVCQIVSKLFDAVQPDRAYFGEKDFQQLAIIREMVCQMKYPLEIVGCPIVREEDGLALSSRNARLSAEERKNALKISQTLFESRTFGASHTVAETQKFVEDTIAAAPGLRLEYFELVDGNGKTFGYARSIWAAIDVETRRPTLLDIARLSAYVTDRPCPIEKPGKIAAVENETEGVPYFIKYSDLDINGHLNSIKYMEHLLDLFDLDLFKTKDIKRFEIAYQSEGKYGMKLMLYKREADNGKYDMAICNEGKAICRAAVMWH